MRFFHHHFPARGWKQLIHKLLIFANLLHLSSRLPREGMETRAPQPLVLLNIHSFHHHLPTRGWKPGLVRTAQRQNTSFITTSPRGDGNKLVVSAKSREPVSFITTSSRGDGNNFRIFVGKLK